MACLMLIPAGAAGQESGWRIEDSIRADLRLRYEHADQLGLHYSDALTARLRLGLEAPLTERMGFYIEGEFTATSSYDKFDPYPGDQGTPGHTVIADPRNMELNRAYITYKEGPVVVDIGRQRIIRNNARYIGNVGWRQNEQTFDAILADIAVGESWDLTYGFMRKALRIFGKEAEVEAQRYFDMSSHLLEFQYAGKGPVKAGAYAYLLQMKNAKAQSSDTYGFWLTGTHPMHEGLSLGWRAEMAKQSENSMSPDGSDFDLNYFHLVAGLKTGSFGIDIGGEKLEGDDIRGFSTPLATLHAFNGFADVFLATPPEGLQDLYVKASATLTDAVRGALILHRFATSGGGTRYGKEIDAVISWKVNEYVSLTTKWAAYDGEKGAPYGKSTNVEKFWLQADVRY